MPPLCRFSKSTRTATTPSTILSSSGMSSDGSDKITSRRSSLPFHSPRVVLCEWHYESDAKSYRYYISVVRIGSSSSRSIGRTALQLRLSAGVKKEVDRPRLNRDFLVRRLLRDRLGIVTWSLSQIPV